MSNGKPVIIVISCFNDASIKYAIPRNKVRHIEVDDVDILPDEGVVEIMDGSHVERVDISKYDVVIFVHAVQSKAILIGKDKVTIYDEWVNNAN